MEDNLTRLERLVQRLETAPAARLCAKIGSFTAFCIVAFTGYQIWVDLNDRNKQRDILQEERAERRESEKLRAWSYLLDPALPPRLRGSSISTLVKGGETLNGVELGCRPKDDSITNSNTCRGATVLDGIDLRDSSVGWLSLTDVVLRNATLSGASFWISGTNNYFDQSTVSNSAIQFDGFGNGIINSSITASDIFLSYTQIFNIVATEVSGTCLSEPPHLQDEYYQSSRQVSVANGWDSDVDVTSVDVILDKVWAYADNPPACPSGTQNIINISNHITYCDPEYPVSFDQRLESLYDFSFRSWLGRDDLSRYETRLFPTQAAVFGAFEAEVPQNEVLLGGFRGCRPMSLGQAMASYPEKYEGYVVVVDAPD
ncbi:hypothetical protein [Loktanella sp. 3ANDIMAR09]|uniref:hypothetical protein n=1 Tax=Loktanella sp. 3ANDIMAR09 TaxID=1225657 RepID=UPI000A626218|nr:hypothetical protein [Loktanella sp. 3ANDIMAR09]